MARRRVAQLERENAELRQLVPAGSTVTSPFAEAAPARSILPWRRREVTEAASSAGPQLTKAPARQGYLADVPIGGATEYNQAYTQVGGIIDRRTWLNQLQEVYVSCPWSNAAVDTIARFCSAGAMDIVDDVDQQERLEKVELTAQAQKAQALFSYVNPTMNFRQLMRTIFTDLLIYGDSFIEVVWALGEPIALFSLPCPDMVVLADEHGAVSGYIQRTETNRKATFKPHEVIHIRLDSPRGGLYGLSPTEKSIHPIVTWMSTEGLLKRTMERGNPPNIAIGFSADGNPNDRRKQVQQYHAKNLGPTNVGNPIEVEGATEIKELAQNKLAEYVAVKNNCRDEICGGYGTPPAILSIIESGNLGGGTGTSQFKTFRVNTCGPLEELVLEAFTFAIVKQGFKIQGKRCAFQEVDWRDDAVIESIRSDRVKTGLWTLNRARDEIGEPPVPGGTDAVVIQTRDVVRWQDIEAMGKAAIAKAGGTGDDETDQAGAPPGAPAIGGTIKAPTVDPATGAPKLGKAKDGKPASVREAVDQLLAEAWAADIVERRSRALRELTEAQR